MVDILAGSGLDLSDKAKFELKQMGLHSSSGREIIENDIKKREEKVKAWTKQRTKQKNY